jgi:hypothetical protein
MSNRPAIPSDVAFQLRKESGFGCCNCGCPIIEYHHIIPWEEQHHFDPQDMMALCPTCHVFIGSKDRSIQYQIKSNPKNIKDDKVGWKLPVYNNKIQVELGNTLFLGEGQILRVDNNSLLELHVDDLGRLELTIDLKDKLGNTLATINKNQWESDVSNIFDVRHTENKLEISSEKHEISLKLEMKNSGVKINGTFWSNRNKINVQTRRISINGRSKSIGLNEQVLFSNTCLCILSETGEYFIAAQDYFKNAQIASLIPIILKAQEEKKNVILHFLNQTNKSAIITELDGFSLSTDCGQFDLYNISSISEIH